jgi:pyruvate/2-oxoglutarate dehydrogenase complex dihydrolipoamide acyltransferase (E2) component
VEVPIQIPKLSLAIHEATPVGWVVADGQMVVEGDALYLVETDKVETEVTASASGVVHWEADLQEAYPVGTRIGRIETPD